jgi:hypothetical protein
VAVTNRMTSLLKQYFPQDLDWVGDVASRQACDFLKKWPTLAPVERARPRALRTLYQQHNCRTAGVIDERIRQIVGECPLTGDPAIVDPLSLCGADVRHATPGADRGGAGVRYPHHPRVLAGSHAV